MASQTDVVGLGSCTVDFFALVPRLIGAEEKINSTRLEVHAGGVTANNLTQVARLGGRAGWIGLVGDDENGRIIRKQFSEDRMDLSGIVAVPGELSSFTWIPVDANGWGIGPRRRRRQLWYVRPNQEMASGIKREGRARKTMCLAVVLTTSEPVGKSPKVGRAIAAAAPSFVECRDGGQKLRNGRSCPCSQQLSLR
jgi:hypothetical protein